MNKTEMEGTMDKSCLDCKYANFSLRKGKEGRCVWYFPSKSPMWLLEYPFDATEMKKLNKNHPYVNCPAWEGIVL